MVKSNAQTLITTSTLVHQIGSQHISQALNCIGIQCFEKRNINWVAAGRVADIYQEWY